ncbi:recombinase family protein [Roseobacter fucihabitans]
MTGQNLEAQIEPLQAKGCDKIFQEKLTGFDRRRPQLEKMLSALHPNDMLIVTSLDRLARSTHDLFVINRKVEVAEATFRSLREPWADTTSSMGKF